MKECVSLSLYFLPDTFCGCAKSVAAASARVTCTRSTFFYCLSSLVRLIWLCYTKHREGLPILYLFLSHSVSSLNTNWLLRTRPLTSTIRPSSNNQLESTIRELNSICDKFLFFPFFHVLQTVVSGNKISYQASSCICSFHEDQKFHYIPIPLNEGCHLYSIRTLASYEKRSIQRSKLIGNFYGKMVKVMY